MDYHGRKFDREVVPLDGNSFEGCGFHRCTLMLDGTGGSRFGKTEIADCTIHLTGAALRTAVLLFGLSNIAGTGGSVTFEANTADGRVSEEDFDMIVRLAGKGEAQMKG